jgi:hypothetical protein
MDYCELDEATVGRLSGIGGLLVADYHRDFQRRAAFWPLAFIYVRSSYEWA